jgi:orotidine-5'-phosphate decarboxylase
LSDDDALTIFKRTAKDQVDAMLDLAEEAGIDGVVCSPHELRLVTKRKSLQSITPGIRITKAIDDQSRVMSPREAIERGSNYLVIGRPITEAKDINATLNEIYNSI